VIDPTALPEQLDWEQPEYLIFWGSVIERFVGTVVFADGWEHSNGCTYEFLVSCKTGARTLDSSLQPLDPVKALAMMSAAITQAKTWGLPVAFRESVARTLATMIKAAATHRSSV
jgi:hypothetical protein